MDTCICITESVCCTPEINTTLLMNYAPIKQNFKPPIKDIHTENGMVEVSKGSGRGWEKQVNCSFFLSLNKLNNLK